MKRRTLIATALVAAALLVLATAAFADPPTSTTSSVPTTTQPAAPDLTQSTPGSGIQVGPPLPADQGQGGGTPGGQVDVGTENKPAWWDIPGRVRYGIDAWFRGVVTDALSPMLDLIGKTVLATP